MGAILQDMSPREQWFAGEDRVFTYEVTVGDTTDPEDMSLWTSIIWELKTSLDAASALVSKTLGGGITVGAGEGDNSKASVVIASADTIAVAAGDYFHVIRRGDTGQINALTTGKAKLRSLGLAAP